jgi:hypothetical protein
MNVKQYMKKCDELTQLWDKTRDPNYKDMWYKTVKKFGDLYEVSSDSNSTVRRNSNTRKTSV